MKTLIEVGGTNFLKFDNNVYHVYTFKPKRDLYKEDSDISYEVETIRLDTFIEENNLQDTIIDYIHVDAKELIKRRELYMVLETATDKCEDAGNVIESIVVKFA